MKVEFTTNEFVSSHGKEPRGRGSWAFQLVDMDYRSSEGEVHFSPDMTLAQARKWVKEQVKSEVGLKGLEPKTVTVAVLP